MRRKILTYIGVSLLIFVVFVLAIFVTLPTESIRHLAEKTIEKLLKQEQSIEIEDLSISPLLNVTLKNFQMRPRNPEPVADNLRTAGGEFNGFWCAPYVEDQTFVIDEIFVNPSIFKILRKKPAGKFELKIQEGLIKGDLQSNGDVSIISAEAKKISMNEFALLSNLTKAQIYGELEFDLRTVLDKSKLSEAELELSALNTAVCPKRIKLNTASMPYFELPFTVFGNISASITVEKDKVKIQKLTSDGPDIKLDVKGTVTLKSETNAVPRFNLEIDVTPSVEWITENKMKAIYQLCEKLDDGSIHISLSGTSKKPKFDCGTPIPEPVEETNAAGGGNDDGNAKSADGADANKAADDNKKADDKNVADDKKKADESGNKDGHAASDEQKKNEEIARPVRPNRQLDDEQLRRDPALLSGENRDTRLRTPNRPNMPRGNRTERAVGARSGQRMERNLEENMEQLRGAEKLSDNVKREARRRSRASADSVQDE